MISIVSWVGKNRPIYMMRMEPKFGPLVLIRGKGPSFEGLTFQNRGHSQVPCIYYYTQIDVHLLAVLPINTRQKTA